MNYQTYPISSDFRIKVQDSRDKIKLSDYDERLVNQIWSEARARSQNTLFNGRLLRFISFQESKNEVIGEFVEYKYYIAHLRNQYLKSVLNIYPIGISCICTCQNMFLFGKRSSTVTDYSGYYELVPSGGIDPESVQQNVVNLQRQAKRELTEETGIAEQAVKSCIPYLFVVDHQTGIYEVCLKIELNRREEMEIPWKSDEYDLIEWKSLEKARSFIEKEGGNVVPLTRFLFQERTEELL
ncbi:MAG: NUDIX hydrolase [Parachlamydiaceae bacterium]